MKHSLITLTLLTCAATGCVVVAQRPEPSIDPQRHGNLAAAQDSIAQAYASVSEAQRDNRDHLGGHAQKAKDLLNQANEEVRLAADTADASSAEAVVNQPGGPEAPPPDSGTSSMPPASQPPPPPQPPPNLSGNWTIYAYNVNQPGSSLKNVQLMQQGNILSGTFHGPHQHGKLQGWVNGNHVEFSTDTHEVLTFRGEITQTGMSGLYGIHGQHAPWNAERTQ